jgi:hypothetical protein
MTIEEGLLIVKTVQMGQHAVNVSSDGFMRVYSTSISHFAEETKFSVDV